MAISITVNGGSRENESFLIAPQGKQEFPMPVGLKTTDGTTVQADLAVVTPAGVTVELSRTSLSIGPATKTVQITAKTTSKKARDIRFQVKVKGKVLATYLLTAITDVRLRFRGRFQARFATDGDFFNEPRGTNAGWTWALEGEPDFVPAANNIPTAPGMAVGRVVRFNNAVAPRPHVAPIGVKITHVEGRLSISLLTLRQVLSFPFGDPIIAATVNLGPNTYLASNAPNPPGPQAFETYGAGLEPMENFELHIGNSFSGKPATLNDRPKSNEFAQLTTGEKTKYGVVTLSTFNTQRKADLLADFHNLSPADRTGTVAGRNLATRIGHLGGSAADGIPQTQGTLQGGWTGKEVYNGNVNSGITINPGKSVVMGYLKSFSSFRFSCTLLNFHSDELCGQIEGTLRPLTALLNRQLP